MELVITWTNYNPHSSDACIRNRDTLGYIRDLHHSIWSYKVPTIQSSNQLELDISVFFNGKIIDVFQKKTY